MTVVLQKDKPWYRQMAFPGVEFQLQGRNSDKTHRLAVRSVKDETLVAKFDIEDPNSSKDMYLRAAESQFLNEILERARRAREHRRSQPVQVAVAGAGANGHQVQQGQERQPGRAAEGVPVENNEAAESVDAKPARKGRKGSQASHIQG